MTPNLDSNLDSILARLRKPEEITDAMMALRQNAMSKWSMQHGPGLFAAALLDLVQRQDRTVDELAMLVRQFVHCLSKAAPDHTLPARAVDYLQRHGLQGSVLRDAEAETTAREVGRTLDALIAERDALKAEVERLRPKDPDEVLDLAILKFDLNTALAREKRLREYLEHKLDCEAHHTLVAGLRGVDVPYACTCGLDALLKEG